VEDEVITLDIKFVRPAASENKQRYVNIHGKQKKSIENADWSNPQFMCFQKINSYSKPYLLKL
jgi:hypothetical protein